MKRFILTGAPGAGKTAVIRQLELDGFSVVEEAATDIIALEQSRSVPRAGEFQPLDAHLGDALDLLHRIVDVAIGQARPICHLE